MTELPHSLPFRLAYEVKHNFPLCHLNFSHVQTDNYVVGFELRPGHPIYRPARTVIRIDMAYVEHFYQDPEQCVTECLSALIKKMKERIRPNTTEKMLQIYAPWMNSPNYSHLHPKTPPSADTSQPELTQE